MPLSHAPDHFSSMPAVMTDEAVSMAAAAGGGDKRAYVQQIFSEIAPRYDLLNHLLSFNIDRIWRNRAIGVLEPDAGNGVYLDLCAGTLDVSEQMTSWKRFRGRVISADFAEPMLRAGIAKTRGRRISPVAADALELPLGDGCVDGAIVAFGIRNVASLDSGLREVNRVLRPGAKFVILEFSTPRFAPVRWLYHAYFHHVLPFVGGLISGHGTAYRYLPRSVANFPVQEELAERMRRAGFQQVEWTSLTLGIAAIHQGVRA